MKPQRLIATRKTSLRVGACQLCQECPKGSARRDRNGKPHVRRRPLPARPAGEGDSVARSSKRIQIRPLPPCVAGESDSYALGADTLCQQLKPGRQNLIHLPDEPAGVFSNLFQPSLATESRSPATQGGRGRNKPWGAAQRERSPSYPTDNPESQRVSNYA